MPKAVVKLEDWLKTHKASEIEEAALLLGLGALSFKTLGIGEEVTTETYISGYRQTVRLGPSGSYGYGIGIRGQTYSPAVIYGQEPIYATREVKKKVYHPESALVGPIAFKLAQAPNLAAGGAGLLVLGTLGLLGSGLIGKTIDLGAGLKLGIPTLEQLGKTITG